MRNFWKNLRSRLTARTQTTAPAAAPAAAPIAPSQATAPVGKTAASPADRPLGDVGYNKICTIRFPDSHRTVYEPTRASGDVEDRPDLRRGYGERAVASVAAVELPGLRSDWHADRTLVAWAERAVEDLAAWKLSLTEAWQSHQRARSEFAAAERPALPHLAWAAAVLLAGLGAGISVVFVLLAGEAVDLLLAQTWVRAIVRTWEMLPESTGAEELGHQLVMAAPAASAVVAVVMALMFNWGQAGAALIARGRLHAGLKLAFVAVDLLVCAVVYALRATTALAEQALPAGAIELALLLLNTTVVLAVCSALVHLDRQLAVLNRADRVAAESRAWLQTVLAEVATATHAARTYIDAIGLREQAGYWRERDAKLATIEAELGYVEALRDNYADALRAMVPQDDPAAPPHDNLAN